MDNITSLEFTYRSAVFYALLRTKVNEGKKHYYITVMNGDLERLLYGHHVICEDESNLWSVTDIADRNVAELKQCIIDALYRRLNAEKAAATAKPSERELLVSI